MRTISRRRSLDVKQPVAGDPRPLSAKRRQYCQAVIVAANDDIRDLENIYARLKCRHHANICWLDEAAEISVREYRSLINAEYLSVRYLTIRANEQEMTDLSFTRVDGVK